MPFWRFVRNVLYRFQRIIKKFYFMKLRVFLHPIIALKVNYVKRYPKLVTYKICKNFHKLSKIIFVTLFPRFRGHILVLVKYHSIKDCVKKRKIKSLQMLHDCIFFLTFHSLSCIKHGFSPKVVLLNLKENLTLKAL